MSPSLAPAPRTVASSQTFAQKALARACGAQSAAVGEIVDARPDLILSHDASAAIRQIWLRLGQERVFDPQRMVITLDHAVPAPTTRHAQNHDEIRAFVAEQGIQHFFEVGDGICHQVISEEGLLRPGELILGGDSHTPHFGWMGAFGAGVGRTEVAALWATGELWLRVPEAIRINVVGSPREWVTSKDLALTIIGTLGADGGLYRSIEFAGPGISALSLSSRMTLANMMAEFGAKNSYLEPDQEVFDYLARAALRREMTRREPKRPASVPAEMVELPAASGERAAELKAGALYPDDDAKYVEEHHFDLQNLQPQVACPHTVDNTVDVTELAAVHVQQAFLGTCTNGRLEDLEAAHRILKGRRIQTGTRFLIVPASKRVFEEALERGLVSDLLAAGAVFGTPGCGPCMGNHMGVLAPGEACISSANRNFRGRMGTADSEIYLASPAVVAASALTGRITSPAEVTDA